MAFVFLNGEILDENDAKISINDTGYYFGDGIYEVILLNNGKLIDKERHLDRLMICFNKVYFKNCPTKTEVLENIQKLLDKNNEIKTASIYMQFTRGTTLRTHEFSNLDLKPNCLIKMIPCEINRKKIKSWHCNVIEELED